VLTGRSCTRRVDSFSSSYSSFICSLDSVMSACPVQPESTASSARYSSAGRPMDAAFTRSGRSFETTVTSRPSPARLSATARMRESLVAQLKSGRQHASCWSG